MLISFNLQRREKSRIILTHDILLTFLDSEGVRLPRARKSQKFSSKLVELKLKWRFVFVVLSYIKPQAQVYNRLRTIVSSGKMRIHPVMARESDRT